MSTSQVKADYRIIPVPERDILGEGPWWSRADQFLIWVDIWGRKIRRCRIDGSAYQHWDTPSDIGFVVPGGPDWWIAGLADGLHWFSPREGSFSSASLGPAVPDGHRLNDGKSDRAGRLWFGTIREDGMAPSASLYRFDGSTLEEVLGGVTTSNGLGWSPDGRRMYYTDSPARTITAFTDPPETGRLDGSSRFSRDPADYTPDGLTVDSEGYVWSAKWDGAKVVRYAPDGTPVLELLLPIRRPTSCMFAGPDLDVLAITSARSPEDDAPGESLAGSVFLVDVGVTGLPESPLSFTRT